MPTLDLENDEIQILINAVAMANPLVRKIMEQLQQQQEQQSRANLNTQRSPTSVAAGPARAGAGNSTETC